MGGKNLFQRSPALLLPHQPLLPCTINLLPWASAGSTHPGHQLAAPSQTRGTQRVPSTRLRQHSLSFVFIYYYSLLLFIYSLLFLFRFEHAQLCHLGFAENVNKKGGKKKEKEAAFKCSLSLHEYISHPKQLPCSQPGIGTLKKAMSSLCSTSIPPSNVFFIHAINSF